MMFAVALAALAACASAQPSAAFVADAPPTLPSRRDTYSRACISTNGRQEGQRMSGGHHGCCRRRAPSSFSTSTSTSTSTSIFATVDGNKEQQDIAAMSPARFALERALGNVPGVAPGTTKKAAGADEKKKNGTKQPAAAKSSTAATDGASGDVNGDGDVAVKEGGGGAQVLKEIAPEEPATTMRRSSPPPSLASSAPKPSAKVTPDRVYKFLEDIAPPELEPELESLVAPPSSASSSAPLIKAAPVPVVEPEISWVESPPQTIQGGHLQTFSFANPNVTRVRVELSSPTAPGRPLDADLELWQGPDNTPVKVRVYVEDGRARPFQTVIETPRGPNTVAVRNGATLEFPMEACVSAEAKVESGSGGASPSDVMLSPRGEETMTQLIQGGARKTFVFEPSVDTVRILLRTDSKPLNARINLLQGPNNYKQVVDVYTEDGTDRPFYLVVETPGSGNVIKVINTAPMEFPLTASVAPA